MLKSISGEGLASRRRNSVGAVRLCALMMVLVALLTGCEIAAKYRDVSNDPELVELIGRRFRLVEPMMISGVNLPPGYGNEIQVYQVDPIPPGWNGPEVITRETLPIGTVVTVTSVVECCFGTDREAIIDIHPYKTAADAQVRIDLEFLVDSYMKRCSPDEGLCDMALEE